MAGNSAPQVVLISSGSEVGLVVKAQEQLVAEGIHASVVSMPSHELFADQDQAYRDSVLPPDVPRVMIEAAHPMSWRRWAATGDVILGIERFGASAPADVLFEKLGLTVEKIVSSAKTLVKRAK
jgi:transketolase